MSVLTGVTLKVLINQYDVTGYFRKLDQDMQISMYDSTVFGNTSKSFIPGLRSGTLAVEGLFEAVATVGAPDNVFAAIEAAAVVPLVSVFPEGWAVGKRAYLLQAHENNHNIGAEIDALILNRAEFTDNDGYDFGISLHALAAETVFTFEGTSVNNAAASTNGGVAFLHVAAIAGGAPNITFRIQHATDNATWVDLVTFVATTAAESQRIAVAAGTTVRQYIRVHAVEGGTTSSVTFSASFARR